jgi:hypothetical protein
MNEYTTNSVISAANNYGGLTGLMQPRAVNLMDYGQPTGPEHTALGNLQQFYQGPQSNGTELSGLGVMQQAADPSRQLAAGQDYMQRVLGPMAINQLTAAGQGRSGAVQEALANAASGIALPILQNTQQLQSQFGGTLANYGQQLFGRQSNALSNLASLAAVPRLDQAGQQNLAPDTLLSILSRFPVNSGAGTTTSSQIIPKVSGGEPPVWQQVMGGVNSLMSIAGMAAMMCWVAAALWAESDWTRFVCAFYQMNFGKPSLLGRLGRKLYRRFGQTWASSKLARAVLRPFLNRAAIAGARQLGVTL